MIAKLSSSNYAQKCGNRCQRYTWKRKCAQKCGDFVGYGISFAAEENPVYLLHLSGVLCEIVLKCAEKCGKKSKVFRRKYSRSGKKSEVHSLRRIHMWNCRRARFMSRGWMASGTGKRPEQRRTVQIRTAGFPKDLPALKNLFSEGRVFQTDETSYSYRSGRGKRFCLLEDAGVSFLYLF